MITAEREAMAREVIEAMQKHYEEHGETADFENGLYYLTHSASEEELREEHAKWCCNP